MRKETGQRLHLPVLAHLLTSFVRLGLLRPLRFFGLPDPGLCHNCRPGTLGDGLVVIDLVYLEEGLGECWLFRDHFPPARRVFDAVVDRGSLWR